MRPARSKVSLQSRGSLWRLFGRVIVMLATLWVVATFTFLGMRLIPGDPFSDPKVTPQVRENLYRKYGLDKPLYKQYVRYLGNLSRLDFGVSYVQLGRSVNDIIAQGFPVSAELGLWALLLALFWGTLLGTLAGLHHEGRIDRYATFLAALGVSVPSFILALLFQYVFAFRLGLFPVAGWEGGTARFLPALTLSILPAATIARLLRASILDVLRQDYIQTARIKGLAHTRLLVHHILRNAALSVVTYLGPMVVNITTGSFVIETIFNVPGLGKYYVQSIYDRDYTLVMGTTVFYAALLIVAMFLVDIAYGLLDPRIRTFGAKER